MSWTGPSGSQIVSPRQEHRDDVRKLRARAVAMCQLQAQGWSLREIGRFFGVKHANQVKRIIEGTPEEARKLRGQRLVG